MLRSPRTSPAMVSKVRLRDPTKGPGLMKVNAGCDVNLAALEGDGAVQRSWGPRKSESRALRARLLFTRSAAAYFFLATRNSYAPMSQPAP